MRISDLPLLTATEQQHMLAGWNDTVRTWQKQNVHQLFDAQASRTPEAVALVEVKSSEQEEQEQDKTITYGELNRQANRVAHYLRKRGVGPEVLVGVCMPRSIHMVVGLLGILKAGGAYVPLDPTYPQERLSFMVADARLSLVLSQSDLLHLFPSHQQQTICLDRDQMLFENESADNIACSATLANLAYVIYTSGSTGNAKGVAITHQGLCNYLNWCTEAYDVAQGTGAPVHSPLSFDLTVTSLLSPLMMGQRVLLLPEDQPLDSLINTLRTGHDFTLVKITPAHLHAMNQAWSGPEVEGRTRRFIIGGEALYGENLTFWQANAPHTRLVNEYGPTETVVGCCVYEVPDGTHLSGPVPIGRPIANTQLYVLDARMRPVPAGVTGELYIGGTALARSYYNQPAMTAERFLPDPYSCEPGARLYKTGDAVRYLHDGNLEYVGRLDRQEKLRGFRIEPAEIEVALTQHPAVHEAAVIIHGERAEKKRLVAYVVLRQDQTSTITQLRQWLSTRLPEYMIPNVFLLLDQLPLTPNGKLDRIHLPPPDLTRPDLLTSFIAPRSNEELLLARIWTQVLGVEQIGVTDNFFELGGHSLLATQVVSRIRDAFHLDLPLRTLFQAPTIASLAIALVQRKAAEADADRISQLLATLEQLSDDEVQALLASAKQPTRGDDSNE